MNNLTRRLHVSSGQQRVWVYVLVRKRCEVPDLCSEWWSVRQGLGQPVRQMRVPV